MTVKNSLQRTGFLLKCKCTLCTNQCFTKVGSKLSCWKTGLYMHTFMTFWSFRKTDVLLNKLLTYLFTNLQSWPQPAWGTYPYPLFPSPSHSIPLPLYFPLPTSPTPFLLPFLFMWPHPLSPAKGSRQCFLGGYRRSPAAKQCHTFQAKICFW